MAIPSAAPSPAGTPFRIWSIEADPLFASIAMNLIDLAGLSDVVTVVTGKSEDTLRRLKAESALERIDVLFLDHLEKLYEPDLKVAESLDLLKPGSRIWADNVVRSWGARLCRLREITSQVGEQGVKGLIMPGELYVSTLFLPASPCSVCTRKLTRCSNRIGRN